MNENGSSCKVSVDGTDFRIFEPTPFSPRWFSHKFKGPGLRYEVGLCIQTGDIVWLHGPFPCGDWPDLRIARDALVHVLDEEEYYLADGGYYDGDNYSMTPNGLHDYDQRQKAAVRARHETVNKRFKDWMVLERRFRHELHTHGHVLRAVANITQLMMNSGEPLFQVEYDDNDR